MNIIGDKEKLIGCNMKVVRSIDKIYNSHSHMGEIHEIEDINSDDNFFYDKEGYSSFDISEVKIVLDDEFIKNFQEKTIVVHCPTIEEAKAFCSWMHNKGLKWNSRKDYLNNTSWDSYKENTCYNRDNNGGFYCNVNYYRDKGYTIIRFDDCVIDELSKEKGTMYFPSEDFINYWKENDVVIKFETLEDRNNFTKLFDDYEDDSFGIYNCCVEWDNSHNEWLLSSENNYKDTYEIIKFEDIKDWEPKKKDFKIGDRVKVIQTESGAYGAIGKTGTIHSGVGGTCGICSRESGSDIYVEIDNCSYGANTIWGLGSEEHIKLERIEEMNFKVGDKVERIDCDFIDIDVGDRGTIKKIWDSGAISLEEYDFDGYDPKCFKLVEEVLTESFKVGDIIIAKETHEGNAITKDKEYEVLDVGRKYDSGMSEDWVMITDNTGNDTKRYQRRFTLKEKFVNKYIVVKSFTLKDILDYNPCNTEYNKLVQEVFERGFTFKDIFKGETHEFTEDNWRSYETLKENEDWLIDHGFLKKAEKSFKPFTLNLKIETKDDLLNLYHRTTYNSLDDYGMRFSKPNSENVFGLYKQVVKALEDIGEQC